MKLYKGDCLDIMATMEPDSIDTIITDPPYGISFMSANWDHGVPGIPFWEAALRVAKPGAMLLAFGGTRTSHRLACAIEDAGWEIRDTIVWLYASGFPKSHSIGKALDRAAGAEREVVGEYVAPDGAKRDPCKRNKRSKYGKYVSDTSLDLTAPATDAAKLWDGWGTALSPSHEPIILAMKPRDGTFANNALKHGVAGLWIDGGRIETGGRPARVQVVIDGKASNCFGDGFASGTKRGVADGITAQGRWPKNTIFSHHPDCVERGVQTVKASGHWPATIPGGDRVGYLGSPGVTGQPGKNAKNETIAAWDCHPDCAVRLLAEQSGGSGGLRSQSDDGRYRAEKYADSESGYWGNRGPANSYADTGTAARFFYCAKSSRKERDLGLDGAEASKVNDGRQTPIDNAYQRGETLRRNTHPTVKPLEIMRYLCRLTKTPTGGVVLDPFMGSGTTGMAAILEGRDFIGIDISAEYIKIAEKRIAWAQAQPRRLL